MSFRLKRKIYFGGSYQEDSLSAKCAYFEKSCMFNFPVKVYIHTIYFLSSDVAPLKDLLEESDEIPARESDDHMSSVSENSIQVACCFLSI